MTFQAEWRARYCTAVVKKEELLISSHRSKVVWFQYWVTYDRSFCTIGQMMLLTAVVLPLACKVNEYMIRKSRYVDSQ